MTVAQRMTAEAYLALEGEEYRNANLVDGVVVMNDPLALHQAVAGDIVMALWLWIRGGSGRGQAIFNIDVSLDDYNVYSPDLLWYREGRQPGRSEVRPQPLPDLAVEIRSPSTWRYDIGTKKAVYERQGLPELWLVDTAADEVLVFRRARAESRAFDVSLELGHGDALTSPQLPGFALALDELFPVS